MSVEIRLTHTNPPYCLSFTRDQIQRLKGSILAQAVGSDTEVTLNNPLVKPAHLNLLAKMSQQEDIKARPPDKGQHKAAVYLDWPLLSVVQNPKYTQMQRFAPYCNLYRPETFGSVLPWAIANNFSMLTHHILQMTELNELDNQALAVAVMYGRSKMTQILLTRGCDPSISLDVPTLFVWSSFSEHDNWSIITGTRSCYERDIIDVKSHHIVWMAIWRCLEGWKGSHKLFRLLFEHPALHQELPKEIYREAFTRGSNEKRNVYMAKILLAQTHLNFTQTYITTSYRGGGVEHTKATLLGELAFSRKRQVFKILAEDPRCPISEELRKEIIGYCECEDPNGQYKEQIDEIQGELLSVHQWQYCDPPEEIEDTEN